MKPLFFWNFFLDKIVAGAAMLLLLINNTGCSKEYSFEGGPVNAAPDSLPPPPIVRVLPFCSICATYPETLKLNQWSLKAEQSEACGILDTAIINLERNSFTFFGPSACSGDTGLVMTVYLENDALNRDITNLTIDRVAFYYYDRVTPSYIYINNHNTVFSAHVDSYQHQSKILIGSFSGNVFRTNGTPAAITGGRFKIKLL